MRRWTISLCLLLVSLFAAAQSDLLLQANAKYQASELEDARALLDQAVKDEAFARSAEAWVLRGFVYKDLFKKDPTSASAATLRDEALASLYVGNEMDTRKQYTENSRKAYEYLAKTIYNDAARSLNDMDEEKAKRLYAKYKEVILRMDPAMQFKERDIEFDNALGTVYTKRFNRDRTQLDWYARALDAYKRVLQADSANYGANYNLATLYYNRGVYNIQQISADNDIPSIQEIQEVSREFFSQALPYMLKAHQMNPARKETLMGLEGIYYSLQDHEKSEEFYQKMQQLEQDGGEQK
ncbi:MAG: hypothetical protein QM724_03260 [Flavobacteriales bacterium]